MLVEQSKKIMKGTSCVEKSTDDIGRGGGDIHPLKQLMFKSLRHRSIPTIHILYLERLFVLLDWIQGSICNIGLTASSFQYVQASS